MNVPACSSRAKSEKFQIPNSKSQTSSKFQIPNSKHVIRRTKKDSERGEGGFY